MPLLESFLIALLALAYFVAIVWLENSQTFLGRALFLLVVIPILPMLLVFYLVLQILGPWLLRYKCPSCGKRKMVVAWSVCSNPPRPAFYLCLGCRARFSRMFSGEWKDASSPEYDDRYTRFEKQPSGRSRE